MGHEWWLHSYPDFDLRAGKIGWRCAICGEFAPPQFSYSNEPISEIKIQILTDSLNEVFTCEEIVVLKIHAS